MVKARLSWLVVAALLLPSASVLMAAPEASGGKGGKIKQLSHEHPEGKNYSIFCGKVTGKPGKTYRVKADGPAVDPEWGPYNFKMTKKRVAKVIFRIAAAGTYFLTLKKQTETGWKVIDKDDYAVPPPPPDGAAVGPFAC